MVVVLAGVENADIEWRRKGLGAAFLYVFALIHGRSTTSDSPISLIVRIRA